MKKLLLAIGMVLGTVPLHAQYTITGHVTDIPDGTKLYLTLVGPPNKNIDSLLIKDGNFTFKGGKVDKPEWALVKVENNFVPLADFYLENGDIEITGSRFSTKAVGTPTNAEYNEYRDSINSLFDTLSRLNSSRALSNSDAEKDSLTKVLKAVETEQQTREMRYLQRHPASVIDYNIIEYRSRTAKSAHIKEMLALLSPTMREDARIKNLEDFANRLSRTENGAPAPDFTLATDRGDSISLGQYRGKYVMIDFWASWCSPCRASFPAIAEIYGKYHSKGLEIIGLSLDRSEEAWRKAVKQENVPWPQVLDAKGITAKVYAVSAIPHLVLVDPDGKIMGTYSKADINDELKAIFER